MAKQGNLLSKTLVIGIIFLFVLISIIPSMAVDNVNINISSGKSSGDDVDWWPMFRHDPKHSGYSTSKVPDTNNVLWSYTTLGCVRSSPAIIDGRVYIGSYDNKVYCLDAITGDYIWSYKTGSSVDSSPAIADGKVYIGSEDGYLYCFKDEAAIEPELKVTIKRGLRRTIRVVIENTGSINVNDITWNIKVSRRGIIKRTILNQNGNISTLGVGSKETIVKRPFGFGLIKVIINVNAPGIEPIEKIVKGFIFLRFIRLRRFL